MVSKYFATLAIVVIFLALAASNMQFVTRSQVLSGKAVEETWAIDFTLDADRQDTYKIGPELKEYLEQNIKFLGEGPVRIGSANVTITPKDVTWTENKTTITSTGAGLVAHVKWDTLPDSANGAHGRIFIHFPELSNLASKGPTFHSGAYQYDNDSGQYVLREVTTYRTSFLLSVARFEFSLPAAIPVGILLHFIFWGFQLRNEKRALLASYPPQGSDLPLTFYTNPIQEWVVWMLVLGLAALIGAVISIIGVSDQFMSSFAARFAYTTLGIGTVLAFLAAYFTQRSVLTFRVESGGISYARGRNDLQWVSAPWNEIQQLSQKFKTYRGNRREWLEIEFKDKRKKIKLSPEIEGYPALRDLLFRIFTPPK